MPHQSAVTTYKPRGIKMQLSRYIYVYAGQGFSWEIHYDTAPSTRCCNNSVFVIVWSLSVISLALNIKQVFIMT